MRDIILSRTTDCSMYNIKSLKKQLWKRHLLTIFAAINAIETKLTVWGNHNISSTFDSEGRLINSLLIGSSYEINNIRIR